MSGKLIGLVAHTGKAEAADLVKRLTDEFAARGTAIQLEEKTAKLIDAKSAGSTKQIAADCDMIVVLGGDGTILQVVHDMAENLKPIFGINIGSLGFLTCVGAAASSEAVKSILAESYQLSRRTLLEVEVESGGKVLNRRIGLNDAVISRGELSRLIKLKVEIDGALLTEYNADGLVISTTTGSTAYSLSAGGPILTPDCGVFAITPICPHVLTNRTVTVSDRSEIEIAPQRERHEVFLTVDGLELTKIRVGDRVRIRRAKHDLPLAMPPGISFFEVLRQKLKWSGTAI
ncbi:MAG: NAD(+)/NADH kinase [Verrucomicrobiota bacterium]|nr:NAD(+)/NADH kinase [Verrucomicrobiota bacterium]